VDRTASKIDRSANHCPMLPDAGPGCGCCRWSPLTPAGLLVRPNRAGRLVAAAGLAPHEGAGRRRAVDP
jgi:hypothetical protein